MQPYRHFAAIYDQVMDTVPYDDWVAFVDRQLTWAFDDARQGESGPAKGRGEPIRLLDACCGTGNVSLRLARRGYRVVGVDRSADMLRVAENKARQALEAGDVEEPPAWSCQDVREMLLPEPVDAAVCLYDSLNYLLTPEDLAGALAATFRALRPGGFFLFDVYQRWETEREIPATQIIQGPNWSLVWENRFDRRTRHWRTDLKGVLRVEGQRRRFRERHVERAYTLGQVKTALTGAGLHLVRAYDGFADRRATRYTERVVYLVRRPPAQLSGVGGD